MKISEYWDKFLSYLAKKESTPRHIKILRIFNWEFSQGAVILVAMWVVFFIIWFTVAYFPISVLAKIVMCLGYLWLWIIVWIFFLVQEIKLSKLKKSKLNWEWIKESLRIISIKEYEDSKSLFYWFYVEVTDWDKIYCSDAYDLFMKEWVDSESNSQYRKINWHTIKAWDMLDVYFDSNNRRWYWVDLEFLFD